MTPVLPSRKAFVLRAGSVALVLAASTLCLAQSTPPPTTRFIVTLTQVKPDMLTEWLDLQKNEVNPAYKKAGISSCNVAVPVFGNTYEYLSIVPLDNYGVLDGGPILQRALGPEAGARLTAKLRKCINGARTYISTRQDDLSILADPKAPPLVSVTIRRRIVPGKAEENRNYIKNELLPVYKKAMAEGKIAGYQVSTRGLGATLGEITTTTFLSKFADLEGGTALVKILGPAGAAKLNAKAVGLSTVVETVARRRVADLSF